MTKHPALVRNKFNMSKSILLKGNECKYKPVKHNFKQKKELEIVVFINGSLWDISLYYLLHDFVLS